MHRRTFLGRVVPAAAAGLALPRFSLAAAAKDAVSVTALGERLTLIAGFGGNVVLFDAPEGVLLVDGGSVAGAPRLLKRVRELTGRRDVHTLFNTHWHRDHTGANEVLGPAGTRILAHENTKLWLGTEINSKWEQKVYPRLPVKARPNQTFYTTGSIGFGGEKIDFGHLPSAHTDGDIYVHFRNANVLVAGDVVSVNAFPILDYSTNGWITGMVNGTQALFDRADDATKIVPGSGPVVGRAQVKEQNEMLVTVRQRLARMMAQGMSLKEVTATQPTREFEARWGDPSLFLGNVWAGMNRHPQELGMPIV